MTASLKYNLKDITDISCSGFSFEIPDEVYNMINYLSSQVGSVGISSKVFKKVQVDVDNSASENMLMNKQKKKRGNKSIEVTSDDWESIRSFQPTNIEQKTGIDGNINEIRLYLNKLTDKTFLDMREKIIDKINSVCAISTNNEDIIKLGITIYDMCSSNKFYSKIFADLFAELSLMYKWLNAIFKEKYANIMEHYDNIRYVDSEKDYDLFCEINKINDKRRAITTFYVNLALNGFIDKCGIVNMLKNIVTSIVTMISIPGKKNEVDELTEIVGILFNKEMIEEVDDDAVEPEIYYVNDKSIIDTVNYLAQLKAKDYTSLSNKAIFKFMDLIDM